MTRDSDRTIIWYELKNLIAGVPKVILGKKTRSFMDIPKEYAFLIVGAVVVLSYIFN